MKTFCSFILCLMISFQAQAGDISIRNAWVAEAPPVSRVHAGYLEIDNHSSNDVSLQGVITDAYDSVEIHLSIEKDGVASMQHIESLLIKAGETVSFAPGGYHLMLFGPTKRWKQGDRFQFTFQFSDNKTIVSEVEVKKMQAAGEQHHHH